MGAARAHQTSSPLFFGKMLMFTSIKTPLRALFSRIRFASIGTISATRAACASLVIGSMCAASGVVHAQTTLTQQSSYSFGAAPIGTAIPLSLFFSNSTVGVATINNCVVSGPDAASFVLSPPTTFPVQIPLAGSFSLPITFTPTRTSQSDATVTCTPGANTVITGGPTQVLGFGLNAVLTQTDVLAFGNQEINTSAPTQNIVLTNLANRSGSITGCSISGTNASEFVFVSPPTFPITLTVGASQTITVRFTPTSVGAKLANVTCTPGAATEIQPTTSGTGVTRLTGAGVISVTTVTQTASLNFGTASVGAPSTPLTVNLQNGPNAAGIITSCTFGGTHASDFAFANNAPTFPINITTTSNIPLGIVFTPSAVGSRTATLTCVGASGTTISGGPTALVGEGQLINVPPERAIVSVPTLEPSGMALLVAMLTALALRARRKHRREY
jgi:hypothetical protein